MKCEVCIILVLHTVGCVRSYPGLAVAPECLVPAILCQCQSCSQASSLSQHGGKPGLAAEQAALGGQAAEADIAEWSPAWPEESTVESGESQWR